jgi:uncharacterized RDD family membrane protein YckC
MNSEPLRYAGFWPRLAALLLDFMIFLPVIALVFWGEARYRLFALYYLIPGTLFGLFYNVYLVKRFGGTPGKLVAGIRIRKVNGEPVAYREALLRYLPEFVFGLLASVALILPLFHMTDMEYQSATFLERTRRINELAPWWYKPTQISQQVLVWGELIVLLTNKKRRALHDFIAGTVVVHRTHGMALQRIASSR